MKQLKYALFLLLLPAWAGLSSCNQSATNDGEDFGNLLTSPQGLLLTEEEHPEGWGRAECTLCHNLENIHLENRTGLPIDIQAIYQQALEEGLSSCASCHGTNGVVP